MITEKDKELVDKITGPIAKIIEFEIEKGNSIVEVSEGWPLLVNVWLKNRFHKDYSDLNVTYNLTNDTHYWYDEYFDEQKGYFVGTRI